MNKKRLAVIVFIPAIILVAACASPANPPAVTMPPAVTTPPTVTAPPAVTTPPNVTTPPPVATPPPVITPPPVTTPPPTPQVAGPNEVWIQGFSFGPQVLTVPVGTTVTWTNKDPDTHDVTSTPAGLFSQQLTGMGGTFSYAFTKAGTYNYVCTIHPGMSGSIVVK